MTMIHGRSQSLQASSTLATSRRKRRPSPFPPAQTPLLRFVADLLYTDEWDQRVAALVTWRCRDLWST